ncbi:MAG: cytochrome c3 family protein [Bacteroidia bacterium]
MKRIEKGSLILVIILGVAVSILAIRCTPAKQYKVLSFFFDGVPDPNKKEEINPANKSDSGLIASVYKPEFYTHKPYEEEKCKSCHAEGISNALLKPVPELCYTCHEDFTVKYQRVHGPVASGNCLLCHNQHMSKYEKILIRPGQDICLYCHESKQVLSNPIHKKIGTANCTECHNPHGGNNSGMITGNSCFTCHTDFSACYPVLHGPVASRNCTACHDSHSSKTPKLLVREGGQLCLFCHNPEQVFRSDAHKKVKASSSCLECHNPHGGQDRFVLLESIRPVKMQEESSAPEAGMSTYPSAGTLVKNEASAKMGADTAATAPGGKMNTEKVVEAHSSGKVDSLKNTGGGKIDTVSTLKTEPIQAKADSLKKTGVSKTDTASALKAIPVKAKSDSLKKTGAGKTSASAKGNNRSKDSRARLNSSTSGKGGVVSLQKHIPDTNARRRKNLARKTEKTKTKAIETEKVNTSPPGTMNRPGIGRQERPVMKKNSSTAKISSRVPVKSKAPSYAKASDGKSAKGEKGATKVLSKTGKQTPEEVRAKRAKDLMEAAVIGKHSNSLVKPKGHPRYKHHRKKSKKSNKHLSARQKAGHNYKQKVKQWAQPLTEPK